MPIELILVVCLIAILVVPIVFDINVGIAAFVMSFAVGAGLLDIGVRDVLGAFPANMFVMLVGITLLLGIAAKNGTVEWLVARLVQLAGNSPRRLPWVLFFTALITASLGPVAAPILFAVGIGLVQRSGMSALLMAAMVVHGTQAGAYSPVAPYGLVISDLTREATLEYSYVGLYAGVVGFHIVLAAALNILLGRRTSAAAVTVDLTDVVDDRPLDAHQVMTLMGFVALIVGLVVFEANLGALAMTIAFVLLLAAPQSVRTQAIDGIAWPVVLVITGVLTFVGLLERTNTTDWLAMQASVLDAPLLIALVLCYVVSMITGVTSTIGTIGILVPMSAPFVLSGELPATGLLTAMAVSAAVSDISPYSTWGAMFLAAAAPHLGRDAVFRPQLIYTVVAVISLPAVAWFAFVVV